MGYNIYEELPVTPKKYASGAPDSIKKVTEEIFISQASGDVVFPGTSFKNCCVSLAGEFPQLKSLSLTAMEGRAFQFFDTNGDGLLNLEEFIDGVTELLNPTSAGGKSLAERLENAHVGKFNGTFSTIQKVAIMGAGVAGLQMAVMLKKVGIQCVIFEKTKDVGGVWQKNYADFGLQVPKELYEFPGFPYPEGEQVDQFPSGPQVQKYIQMYTKHHDLYKIIKFSTPILKIGTKKTGRGWKVDFQPAGQRQISEDFDFVVVATGMYGWPPHLPVARGADKFIAKGGQILHSCTFVDRKFAAGKKVITVGGGKSAVDNAVAAGKEGTSSTLIYREMHWPVPRKLANLVPFKWGTYSRFGHFMLHPHHEEPPCSWWFHHSCAPVKWMWWRVVETMFKTQFHLKDVPAERIETDLFTGGQIVTYEYRDMLESGKVKAIKGSIDRFTEKGVVLIDGQELDADLVIYGTGFKKNYDFIDSLVQENLNKEKDGIYLYRNIIAPDVADIAFIGCEVSTFNNILTHGLQALWLSKVLSGKLTLPSLGGMHKSIEKEMAWKRSWMPPSSARSAIWQLHMQKYHDNLVKDMGENHFRKGFNKVAEVFSPYCARDYEDLFK